MNKENKGITLEQLEDLKKLCEALDPDNKVFQQTKDIIEIKRQKLEQEGLPDLNKEKS